MNIISIVRERFLLLEVIFCYNLGIKCSRTNKKFSRTAFVFMKQIIKFNLL